MTQLRTGVLFDMRAPDFGAPPRKLYAAALDMAAFADEIGVSRVNLMEHHASEDGYLPAPFVMGGGVAARTKQCRISLGAVILPLHDPVKIAEQIAVLDQMSGGRLDVTFGAGYVKAEFDAFGVSLGARGKLLDEGVDTILRALRGERFEANGRPVYVRPLPVQKPEDIILIGGGVEASARRAARFGLGFSPINGAMIAVYEEACRKLGRAPGRIFGPSRSGNIHLSNDPEKTWTQVMPHVRHVVSEYAKWAEQEPNSNSPFRGLLGDDALLRSSGVFNVWTPDELVSRAPALIGDHGGLSFMPLMGGLAPELGWESLELLKAAMPRLEAAIG